MALSPTTLEGLSRRDIDRLVRRLKGTGEPARRIPRHDPARGPALATLDQERLWFLHRLEPDSAAYGLTASVRLDGALEVGAVARALGDLVERHPILATVLEPQPDGGLALRLLEAVDRPRLLTVDLDGLPAPEAARAAAALEHRLARRPYRLDRGPLLRLVLLAEAPDCHRLLLAAHHAIMDGTSIGLLVADLERLYRRATDGDPVPPPPEVRFVDYAAWKRSLPLPAASREHWRRRLDGAVPTHLDLGRPDRAPVSGETAARPDRGEALDVELADDLVARARRFAAERDTTLFVVLLAAYQLLLSRETGRDDLLVGSVLAGREHREIQETLGFFAHTVALRTDLAAAERFVEVLDRTRETVLEALAHQDLPFASVVEELARHPETRGSADLASMFSLDRRDGGALRLGEAVGRLEEVHSGTAKFDLSVRLLECDGRITGRLEHRTERHDRESLGRVWGRYRHLLARVLEAPDERFDRLDLLEPSERSQALRLAEPERRPVPASLLALVRERAAEDGDRVAVVQGDEELTYRQLLARAERLAAALAARGLGPEDRVAVLSSGGTGFAESVLGIFSAGCVYLPIDPDLPVERLELLVDNARPRWVLRVGDTAPLGDRLGRELEESSLERLLDDTSATPQISREAPGTTDEPHPAAAAYVIYTSGSTGRPKGVVGTHGALANLAVAQAEALGLEASDRVLQFASRGFDASLSELAATLAAGATLVLRPRAETMPGPALTATLERDRITALKLPPTSLALMAPDDAPASLAVLAVAGEPCPPDLVERWQPARRARRMFNVYGPTEVTVTSAAGDLLTGEAVTVGRPIANLSAHVLDASLQPVPVGVPGELCLGGVGVTRGYLDHPAATAAAFVPDPFAGERTGDSSDAETGERLYRTGDLARRRADGRIEILGRIDRQVKVRGHRIEPGEVEAALRQLDGVREAVVAARADATGVDALVAWVAGDGMAAPAVLRERLGALLPGPLVPSVVTVVDRLPRTASGKVDLAALPDPATLPDDEETRGGAPRTATERRVARLFGELLLGIPEGGPEGTGGIGRGSDFFDLGGHSLAAVRLAARLGAETGVEIPLRDIFEARTVFGLARRVEEIATAGRADDGPVLRHRGPAVDAPLSFAQRRLWFLERLDPGTARYVIAAAVRLHGRLEAPLLARAVTRVVARQEALRTTFRGERGRPVQSARPVAPVPLPVVDLSGLPEEARRGQAALLARAEGRRPFDLERGPVVRLTLLRLSPGATGDEHRLLASLHHIVSDAWSSARFLRELGAVYRAGVAGRPDTAELPELPITVADHAAWEAERLDGARLEGLLERWREILDGAPELALPTDRAPDRAPGTDRSGGATLLPAGFRGDLLERMERHARNAGTTPFVLLLAGVSTLLHRLTGQDDLVIGVPLAGRERAELENLIGFFVDTLPVRVDLGGRPRFAEVVDRAAAAVLVAQEHRQVPLERLAGELAPDSGAEQTPLLRAVVAYQPPREPLELPGLQVETEPLFSGRAKFDLTLSVEAGAPDGGYAEFSSDLFDRTSSQRLLRRLRGLLGAVLETPELAGLPIDELPLLDPAERHQLVVEWNDRESGFPRHVGLAELVHRHIAATPDAVALDYGPLQVTYGELGRWSGELAGRLRAAGLGVGATVALCLDRSAELVGVTLAVLEIGATYLPLDPDHPADRLAFMLDDAGADLLVTRSSIGRAMELEGPGRPTLWLDREPAEDARASLPAPPVRVPATAPAYVIYTSGSTGRPKGVVVCHRSVVRLALDPSFALGPRDRVLQAANTSFDAAVWEIWGALVNGARLVGADRDTVLDPERLADQLIDRRVSVSFCTTAVFDRLARHRPDAFAGVRLATFGGEAADAESVRRVLAAGAPERLVNLYGPTENAVLTTAFSIPGVADDARTVPIGRPLWDNTCHVVSPRLRPLPVAAVGELVVGGDGVAMGYQGRPAITAERFVPDPFSHHPGDRLYRTGDLVRRLSDGTLAFLGRVDRQVKIRGVRIEMDEVEAALQAHPAVASAVAAALPDARGDLSLTAWIEPAGEGAVLERDDLRRFLAAALPEAMVPSALVLVDALPLNANGKVDRTALPAPGADDRPTAAHREAPRGPVEEAIAAVFSTLLDLPSVGRDDSFFHLGGHSLLATEAVWRLEERLGVEVPLGLLFAASTPAELAAELGATGSGPAAPVATDAEPPGDAWKPGEPAPLSDAQQRLWFLDRLRPDSGEYNVFGGLHLEGRLVPVALSRALDEVVRRHGALRTRFVECDGEPSQTVVPFDETRGRGLPVIDLAALPEPRATDELDRLARAGSRRPFDLGRPPLLRARLVRRGAERHALLAEMHHIVSDGWSVGVLAREIAALYPAFVAGKPSPLAPLPVQVAELAAREGATAASGARDDDRWSAPLEVWRERLAGMPPLELPTDRPRPAVPSARGDSVPAGLDAATTEQLRRLARRLDTTPFTVLLAAIQVVLGRFAGQDDFGVGTVVANRPTPELEGLIGFFVDTLVLRSSLPGESAFAALVERVGARSRDAFSRDRVPFDRLVRQVPELAGQEEPVRVLLAVLSRPPRFDLPGLRVEPFAPRSSYAKFDLTVDLIEDDRRFAGTVSYARDLFDRATVERLWAAVERFLGVALATPQVAVDTVSLLSAEERRQILEEWAVSDRRRDRHPREATLAELFVRVVRRGPDRVAVTDRVTELTYAELDRRSDRLARRLRACGVGPEVAVGLLMDRSLEMVVATLAVIKAGGFYAPLDPEYPADRLAFMLEDTGAPVVLASAAHAPALAELAEPADETADRPRRVLVVEPGAGSEPVAGDDGDDQPLAAPGTVDSIGLAYVMYTSGSTGRPKGVAVPQRAVARLVIDPDWADLGPDETFLQLAPLAFDLATLEIWGPLLNGGRLVLAEPGPVDLAVLGRTLVEERVTTLWLTAGLFHRMVEEQLPSLAGVRQLLAGGDVLSPPHVERALQAVTAGAAGAGGRVIDGYGPTENTTFTSCHPLTNPAAVPAPVPIGRPVAGTFVEIVDRRLEPQPVGVAGELVTGGDGLARGYLHRPGRTAETFVPDPRGRRSGDRVYRTGDRARWLADGTLEFLGRLDTQVKIRGFRIEPGEVETALVELDGVADAAVAPRRDAAGERVLAAWVVPAAPVPPGEERAWGEALRARLVERLPGHLVPAAVVPLAHLPLGPTGKVDRRALPELEIAAAGRPSDESPASPEEELVARVFAHVLGLPAVGRHDDFFRLGGHSLLATRVVSRLRRVLGVEVHLRELFDRPTPAALASHVVAEARAPLPPVETLDPSERAAGVNASFAQRRLWFLDRLDPGSALYAVPVRLRVSGPLDVRALAAALAGIVERHEVLRSRFEERHGEPFQVVEPTDSRSVREILPVVDLAALGPDRSGHAAEDLATAEARRPFDLATGPLLRARLVRRGPERHDLLLTFHHTVVDGWSLGPLFDELAALYAGRELAPLPVQVGDHAVWQRRMLDGAALDGQLDAWRRRLDGVPVLELPTDHRRPAGAERLRGSVPLRFAAARRAALAHLASEHGVTLFMVLLALWQLLLSRITGQRDVAVGSPVAGRTREETERLIGFFANTVVLRGDLTGEPALAELLERTRNVCLEAYAHQEVPFERVVDAVAPERRLDQTPLFQAFFTLQSASVEPPSLHGLETVVEPVAGSALKFDLSLGLFDRTAAAGGGHDGTELVGGLEYDRRQMDATTARRLVGWWQGLVEAVLEAHEQSTGADLPLERLPLLSAAERHQLRFEWAGSAPAPGAGLLHGGFLDRSAETPHRVAVDSMAGSATYGELDQRSARLARHLRAAGAGPEVVVAVAADRTPELLVTLLGVLRAGAAYLPLDPAYPPNRLAHMLSDAKVRLLVGSGGAPDRLPEGAVDLAVTTVLRLEELEAAGEGPGAGSGDTPLPPTDPRQLAYLIYTSGSTGTPKGVAIEHRSAAALLDWGRRLHGADELDGLVAATSVCFDLSVFELFLPLAAGGQIVLVDDALALAELAGTPAGRALVADARTLDTVPSAAAELLRLGALPPAVATVNLAGEPLQRDLVQRLYDNDSGGNAGGVRRVLNLYGPSEATTYATWAEVERDAPGEPTIGRPVDGTRLRLLDPRGREVPPGAVGEIALGGAGLSRGYLERAARTAERYVPDPYAAEPGARLYRTGDLGRHLADGRLVFLGRIDHQVKVRGFRIELGEVEAVLAAHDRVEAAAAQVRGEGADAHLVAFVELAGAPAEIAENAEITEIAAWARERLPGAMVPARLHPLDALPLTPNGKVDRKALAALDIDGGATGLTTSGVPFVAPRDAEETLLAELWCELLGVDRVGVDDDFFALGGHSLRATRLVSRVREEIGVELPLRQLFESPTVAALARVLRDVQGLRSPELPPLAPRERGDEAPLSYAQERLFVLDRFDPGTAAYNIPVALRFEGDGLDLAALVAALAGVVERHEVLRTVFQVKDGRPVQRVLPAAAVRRPPTVADLSGLPEAARERAARQLFDQVAGRGFDLAAGPLIRQLLVRHGTARHDLQVVIHHIVADGWSLGVFLRETADLYAGRVLDPLPVQVADHALWQREILEGPLREGQLAHWRERLEPAPTALDLPLDRPRPPMRGGSSGRVDGVLEPALVERLRSLGGAHRASLFMVLAAGLHLLLARLSGERDLAIGTPVAGRGRREIEGLVGIFLNTLVLRLDGEPVTTFAGLVDLVRQTALDAYAHQEVPFEMLLDALDVERDLARTPLFQVFLNMLELPFGHGDGDGAGDGDGVRFAGLDTVVIDPPEMPSKFDLTLYARPTAEGLRLRLVYDAELFDRSTADRFLRQLTALLAAASSAPDAPLDELSVLGEEERALLPDPRQPLDTTWHGSVAERLTRVAERTPDAVAVRDPDGTWTYRTLERRSNRIAHRLRDGGVAPGDRVVVWAHRSADLVAAVYGVLKAGAAFVVLDPAYPPRRHLQVLELARPKGWVGLAAAPAPAAEIEATLGDLSVRLELPDDLPLPRPGETLPDPGPPGVRVGPDDLAYLAFTSGSTGQPKGILGRHGSLSHFLPWQEKRFGIGPNDRYTLLSGLAHDPLHRDLFTPIWSGASLVIPDPRAMVGAGRLAAWLVRERATVAHLTPAMGQLLAERSGDDPLEPAALRWAFLVGEALTRRHVEQLAALAPHVTCVNLFGSTETQRAVAYHEVPREVHEGRVRGRGAEVLPLGRGMEDVQLLVLGAGGRLCAVGEVGEIHVRSPHLSLGYLGDPELTTERFPPNPFTGDPDDLVYRTGDLGRYLPDGTVSYLGRADQQLKIRGFRIEPGEIQTTLERMPEVGAAVVLAKGEGATRRLVAYVEPVAGGPKLEIDHLREFLRRQLPAYMVPAGWAVVERIPLTPNGKVDRRALAHLDDSSRAASARSRAPETRHEKTVAEIVRQVLGLDAIGAEDNFFDLGGNSLLMVQVHARLEEAFEQPVQMVDLFHRPTVAALASHLADLEPTTSPATELVAQQPFERNAALAEGRNRMKRLKRRRLKSKV